MGKSKKVWGLVHQFTDCRPVLVLFLKLTQESEDMTVIGGNDYSFSGAKTNERSMLVSCKE